MPTVPLRFVQSICVAVLLAASHSAPAQAQQGESAGTVAQAESPDIEKRLRRIEDSLIDMRAMIGALQSFAPGDGTASSRDNIFPEADLSADPFGQTGDPLAGSASQPSGGSGPELQQLEILVQALSAQLSETVQRLNRLEATLGRGDSAETGIGSALPSESEEEFDRADRQAAPGPNTGFGTTTVETPAAPEDGFASWEDETLGEDETLISPPGSQAGSPDAQALFTQAYDALQAQDYSAARDAFQQFLDTYPDDPLANDARYWLADAAFAEGDYVVAANNFVQVYNTAPTGEKSEETLLRLAVVLRRLDRPEAACDALSRLDGRLDRMPDSFLERVADERQRSGCR